MRQCKSQSTQPMAWYCSMIAWHCISMLHRNKACCQHDHAAPCCILLHPVASFRCPHQLTMQHTMHHVASLQHQ